MFYVSLPLKAVPFPLKVVPFPLKVVPFPLKAVLLCVSGDCSTPPLEGIPPAFAEHSAFSPPEEIIHASSLKIGPPVPGNNPSLNGALTDRQIFLLACHLGKTCVCQSGEGEESISPPHAKRFSNLVKDTIFSKEMFYLCSPN